jgi:hypothetical protein
MLNKIVHVLSIEVALVFYLLNENREHLFEGNS